MEPTHHNSADAAGHPARGSTSQMRMVLETSRILAIPADLDQLLLRISGICCKLLDCDMCSIFLHDKQTDQLWSKIVMKSAEIRVPKTSGIVGHAFCHNTMVHVPQPYEDPRFNPAPDRESGVITRSLLAVPMPDIDGNPLGVLEGLNKRNGSFDENDFDLISLVAEQAAVAIQRHKLQQTALEAAKQAAALWHEVDLARKIQQSLMPQFPPLVAGLDAVGWMFPASQTGGDCFDLWKTADGRLGILVADAAGHGLGAALIILQVRSLVRTLSTILTDPHELLGHVNMRLCADLRNGNFVTAFLAFISSDGMVHWTSAGHGPVYVRSATGQPLESLDPPSLPLGLDDGAWADPSPPATKIENTGSLMVVSDGIFEARNPVGQLFEISRMVEVCDKFQEATPDALLGGLRDAVRAWECGHEPTDDQTIVLVQRNPPHEESDECRNNSK